MWKASTLHDGDLDHKLGKLVVTSDSEIEVLWADGLLLVRFSDVAAELENFGCQVFENTGQKGAGRGADTFAETSLFDKPVQTAYWEDGSCFG